MMRRIFCIFLFILLTGITGLKAQEHPATILDGPALTIDSLSARTSTNLSTMLMPAFPQFPQIRQPSELAMPSFETKEQRASRINIRTYSIVSTSVDRYLQWHRPPKLPKPWKPVLSAAKLFLSNPYGFPAGYVPLMNPSFPFIYAKTPGMAPYENPYTSDMFPKCIKSEYDSRTGTYKQVMVDWSEVQNQMSARGTGPSSR